MVALLTESVDWNFNTCDIALLCVFVALLTESVDWNRGTKRRKLSEIGRSPHGERGLKFPVGHTTIVWYIVALLTESVDWNISSLQKLMTCDMSLSSRRAWIEIIFLLPLSSFLLSLSSRRAWIEIVTIWYITITTGSRSPHRERGLK